MFIYTDEENKNEVMAVVIYHDGDDTMLYKPKFWRTVRICEKMKMVFLRCTYGTPNLKNVVIPYRKVSDHMLMQDISKMIYWLPT